MKTLFSSILLLLSFSSAFAEKAPLPPTNPPPSPAPLENLKTYNVDSQGISVSGLSAGAFMAVQMQVAYSQTFSGVGSIAGGVYWCAQGDSKRAQAECMRTPEQIDMQALVKKAEEYEKKNLIDPLRNLSDRSAFIFASPKDTIVKQGEGDKLQEFLALFMKPGRIAMEKNIEAAHGFPTETNGNACNIGTIPWINKCNYDGAGAILKNIYGGLEPKVAMVPAHLHKFDQAEFGDATAALYNYGWAYVPEKCAQGEKCKVHIALHGCQMNPDYVQDKFPNLAGYNEWAESNHIIVLYPQATRVTQKNPYACFDWYGYTGENYATKEGPQMKALMKMLARLAGKS